MKNTILLLLFGITFLQISSCKKDTPGCTDPVSTNYNPEAVIDDGSCTYISGCTDPNAANYNPEATQEDESCKSWSEEMSGTYIAVLACDLIAILNGEFPMVLTAVDDKNMTVNMTLNGFQTFPIEATVDENKITFKTFELDGLNFEIPNTAISVTGITIDGDLTYANNKEDLDGHLKLTFRTTAFPISDNCTITATRE